MAISLGYKTKNLPIGSLLSMNSTTSTLTRYDGVWLRSGTTATPVDYPEALVVGGIVGLATLEEDLTVGTSLYVKVSDNTPLVGSTENTINSVDNSVPIDTAMYIHTNGVDILQQNEETWLKSGVIIPNPSTYPEASRVSTGGGTTDTEWMNFDTGSLVSGAAVGAVLGGIVRANNLYYVLDTVSATITRLNLDFSINSAPVDISAASAAPHDLTTDGTVFWLLGSEGSVTRLNSDLSIVPSSTISLGEVGTSSGFHFNGTYFYVVFYGGTGFNRVLRYTADWDKTAFSIPYGDITDGVATTGTAFGEHNGKFYVGTASGYIYEFDSAGLYTGNFLTTITGVDLNAVYGMSYDPVDFKMIVSGSGGFGKFTMQGEGSGAPTIGLTTAVVRPNTNTPLYVKIG